MPEPPEGYEWEQRDASRIRCLDCGRVIGAGTVDIHEQVCSEK